MQMRLGRSDKVFEDALALLTARRNDAPYAFVPAAAGLAACTPGGSLIDNQGPKRLLGEVVGGLDTGHGQEGEIVVGPLPYEALCKRVHFRARRRKPNNGRDFLQNTMCPPQIGRLSEPFPFVP
ncbi:MAG TPA: hypothetical protein PKX48_13390 [Planctomycetota bacterium]|nr:hypothetical protein [Planctomycetota bacterium]HNU27053.1 hypothetical protein [Planctomycetota bacterium]HOE29618.1 hypothetical protein [Planctomycetota bacterium]HOE86263.1 hypothetical protein [Planctomycetota bacterium]HOR67159.1 hypothetical protein [Planctomycetota bacterium]